MDERKINFISESEKFKQNAVEKPQLGRVIVNGIFISAVRVPSPKNMDKYGRGSLSDNEMADMGLTSSLIADYKASDIYNKDAFELYLDLEDATGPGSDTLLKFKDEEQLLEAFERAVKLAGQDKTIPEICDTLKK